MMRYEIHFTHNDADDHFIVEGHTLADVRRKALAQLNERGLDTERDDVWSKEVNSYVKEKNS